MNLDNINEPTLIVAKSTCITDIVLTFFVFLLGHCKFSVEDSIDQTMVNVFAKDIVSILNNFNISLPNRKNTYFERQQAKDINEYKHDYTYYKKIYLPHASIQWYSCLTGIYTTLIYSSNF